MYAKLRHVSVTELVAAKKEPAKFYRNLYGLKGGGDTASRVILHDLAQQMATALKASPLSKEIADLPEARRVAEARLQQKPPDPADQLIVTRKMLELLPQIGFRPRFSPLIPRATKIPKGLELEKSWHCLHFLFSGKAWEVGKPPVQRAILGGIEIPDTERVMGYGPVRYLQQGEVRKIATALKTYPIKRTAAKFDPLAASAAKIYCPKHSPEELEHYFDLLKNYYREAAAKKHAMLLWIE
jgi:hypothetical protein